MKIKKKILIVGPFVDFGGREIEARNIIVALSQEFDLKLISTATMTKKSVALSGLVCSWSTIQLQLYHSNTIIKGLSIASKLVNKSKVTASLLVNNKLSQLFFNLRKRSVQILKKEIDSVDVVIFCGILTSGFLKETIEYCNTINKAFVLRTTGKIDFVPKHLKSFLPKVSSVLVHSFSNALVLNQVTLGNVGIIDQTTYAEESLLAILINKPDKLTFGFIGRFSAEKGILQLLKSFKNLNANLIIAGSGPLLPEVLELLPKNTSYIGEISSSEIASFYEKIDVLVLPSLEESGPLVGIEAMAAGNLIVSTRVGAMPERLNRTSNNFWFGLEQIESLEEVIARVNSLAPETIYSIRQQVRQTYIDHYSCRSISRLYLELIAEVLKDK